MAFLGKIGNFIRPLATNLIRTVAPAAAQALRSVVGNGIQDLFSKGAGALKGLVSQIPFVGPLASGLVDKLAPKLTELAQRLAGTGIDKLLSLITGANTERPAPGVPGGTVTTPPMSNPTRTETAATNTPVAPPPPSSTTSASTGVSNSGTDATGWAIPNGDLNYGNFTDGKPKWDGRGMPDPRRFNMQDPQDAANFQRAMASYQQAMNNINLFFSTLSTVLKAQNDTAQSISRNIR
ncbi:MAG: hypothetical protein INH41_21535 [Myxococcaceae bacterium]|nr:hypothetical protein [Myxococcaceae bacterium]MCA3014977.1 hypothetical protein [Myxococcaceae bacterium]